MPRLASLGSNLATIKPRLTTLSASPRRDLPIVERIRGRRGVEIRRAFLQANPLCRHCERAGRVTEARIVDHIVPLALGGSDEASNKQGLCLYCNDIKTAHDQRAIRAQGGQATTFPRPTGHRCADSGADSASLSKGIKWPG